MQSSPCLLSISASPWSVWIHIYSQPCAFNFFCGLIKAIWERGILIGWFLFFLFKNLWTAECECLTVTNAALAGSHFFQPASERTDSLSWRKCEEKTNCTHTHIQSHANTKPGFNNPDCSIKMRGRTYITTVRKTQCKTMEEMKVQQSLMWSIRIWKYFRQEPNCTVSAPYWKFVVSISYSLRAWTVNTSAWRNSDKSFS